MPRPRKSTVDATTLDRFGRILLPLPVRRRLGLKAGDRLRIAVEKGRVVLRPEAAEGRWEVREGIPVWTGSLPDGMADIVGYLRRLREEDDREVRRRSGA
jgi:AbrB family looped-hinge helix DNA binding protein